MGSLREAYRRIHASIANALQSLGAAVALAPSPTRTPALDAGACFATAAGGEIVADGLKVVGSAQVRTGGALLQHGSILLRDDQSFIDSVTQGGREMPAVAPLSRLLDRDVSWDAVAAALVTAAESWGDWTELPDRSRLADEADALSHPFRDPAWTWRR
jgi:lipoate-protein ligase A